MTDRDSNIDNFTNVVLFTGPMGHGGIATLIVRLTRALIKERKRVDLFYSGNELLGGIPTSVNVINYTSWSDVLSKFETFSDQRDQSSPLLLVSLDPNDAAMASWLTAKSSWSAADRHITGVFHPRAYFLDGEDWIRFAINRLTLANFRDDQIFFMNEDCRESHARWARRSFSKSSILPLTIDANEERYSRRSGDDFSVVSVGRLAAFKDYNLEIPRIVRDLRRQGIPIKWQIFGHGELEVEIKRRVEQFAVEDFVGVRGTLDYALFAEEVSSHDVFVGMGTAALEAAMLGVPTILAVDGQGCRSYGFLQAVPFGNVGEQQALEPTLQMPDMLIDLFGMKATERVAIGHQSRTAALAYSTNNYASELLRIGAGSPPSNSLLSRLVGMVYRETTVGTTRKIGNVIVRPGRRLFRFIARRSPDPTPGKIDPAPPS